VRVGSERRRLLTESSRQHGIKRGRRTAETNAMASKLLTRRLFTGDGSGTFLVAHRRSCDRPKDVCSSPSRTRLVSDIPDDDNGVGRVLLSWIVSVLYC